MSEVKTINGPMKEDGSPFFARNLRRQWNDACPTAGLFSASTHKKPTFFHGNPHIFSTKTLTFTILSYICSVLNLFAA